MIEYKIDKNGKWEIDGVSSTLIEPSKDYLNRIKKQEINESLKVNYEYPKITKEQELIALQTLEIEDLKDRIIKLEEVNNNAN